MLIPIGGAWSAAKHAVRHCSGLTPDERWDRRFNAAAGTSSSGWGAVIGVVLALMLGAGVLMATIAFSGQRYFEYQVEEARKISQ